MDLKIALNLSAAVVRPGLWVFVASVLAGCGGTDYDDFVAKERAELIKVLKSVEPEELADEYFPDKLDFEEVREVADAAQRLGRMGSLASPAVPSLIAHIATDDHSIRINALEALGKIRDKRAVEPIIEYLSWEERGRRNKLRTACEALGRLDAPEAIVPMARFIENGGGMVAEGTAWMEIGRIAANHPESLVQILQEESNAEPVSGTEPGWWWNRAPPRPTQLPAIYSVIRELLNVDAPHIRAAAMNLATAFDDLAKQDDIARIAIESLSDEDIRVQTAAAALVARSGREDAVDELLGLLNTADLTLLRKAIFALLRLAEDDSVVVEPLSTLLKHYDVNIRSSAAFALGNIGATSAYDALVELVRSDNGDDVEAAIQALGMLGDKRAVELLTEFLGEEDTNIRDAAVAALCEIDSPFAREVLREVEIEPAGMDQIRAQDLRRLEVKREVAFARAEGISEAQTLSEIISRENIDDYWSSAAKQELFWIRNDAIPEFRVLAQSNNPHTALFAARNLAELGDPLGVKVASRHLGSDEWRVVRDAVLLLDQYGNSEQVPLLIDALDGLRDAEGALYAMTREGIVDALWAQTGEDFGEVTGAWRAWWREHRDEFGE